MRKLTQLKTLLLMAVLLMGAATAWADTKSYTITFKDSGTNNDSSTKVTTIEDIISDGASYVSSISDVSNVYNARSGRGLKLGTSSKAGSLTLNLKDAVTPTKITFSAMWYKSGEQSITVNGTEVTELTDAITEYTVNYDGNTEVSSIAISTPSKRAYITQVSVYYEEGGSGGNTLGAPVFTPAAGAYYYGQTISVSASNAVGIVFTADGIDPTDASAEWTDDYILTGDVTLKAMAYDADLNFSDITEAVYELLPPEAPIFSKEGGAVVSGTTLTLTPGEGGSIVVYTTDGSDPDITSDIYDEPITITDACTIKAATVDDGDNLSDIAEYSFTIKEAVIFEKVTVAGELAEGDQLLIVYESENGSKVLGAIASTGKYYEGVDVTIENGELELPDGAAVLTLGGETGAWTFCSSLDGYYLDLPNNSNELRQTETAGDNSKWTISINEGIATITNINLATRVIKWNSGSPRFACYTSGQKDVCIYRLKENLAENVITLDPSDAQSLNYGGSLTVTASSIHGTVTAESSDAEIATVTDNGDGTFTINAVGGTAEGSEVTITFSVAKGDGYKSASAKLTVTVTDSRTVGSISYAAAKVTITVDEAATYTGQALTNEDNLTVTYAISGDAIGTIDEATGNLTLDGTEGTATVTATFAGNDTYKANTASYDITVYAPAVFAEFYESFDTNDGLAGWSGSAAGKTFASDNEKWVTENAFGGYMCARFGTGSKQGVATTPALKLDPEVDYVLTFNAAAWDGTSEALQLVIEASDPIFNGDAISYAMITKGAWKGFFIDLKNGTPTTTITFKGLNASNSRFFLDEVRVMEKSAFDALALNQTVSSNGWATYIPAYNVEFEAGDAFVVTAVDATEGTITIEEVTQASAKTPVLLKGAGEKTITAANHVVEAPATNMLSISNGSESATEYPYVLAKDGDGAGFKQWVGDAEKLAGRVVLMLDFAQPSEGRMLRFVGGEASGISAVTAIDSHSDNVYDLQGRHVNAPQKGLYIWNGKKMLVK